MECNQFLLLQALAEEKGGWDKQLECSQTLRSVFFVECASHHGVAIMSHV